MPPQATPGTSVFAQALANSEALEVPMDVIGLVSFSDGQATKAIGTNNLNGCTAMIAVSTNSAVLAHIAPLPGPTNEPYAGVNHVRENLYSTKFRMSPEVKKFSIVCGMHLNEIALPDQKELIRAILLENLEYNPRPKVIPYQISTSGHDLVARGTILVDERDMHQPKVYVEDRDQGWF